MTIQITKESKCIVKLMQSLIDTKLIVIYYISYRSVHFFDQPWRVSTHHVGRVLLYEPSVERNLVWIFYHSTHYWLNSLTDWLSSMSALQPFVHKPPLII